MQALCKQILRMKCATSDAGWSSWQLVGLITRRSQVQVLPPQPTEIKQSPFFGVGFLFSGLSATPFSHPVATFLQCRCAGMILSACLIAKWLAFCRPRPFRRCQSSAVGLCLSSALPTRKCQRNIWRQTRGSEP